MENHRTRMIMTYIKAYGGMGSSDPVTPQGEWPIQWLDDVDRIVPITTGEEAKELLNQMLDGTY